MIDTLRQKFATALIAQGEQLAHYPTDKYVVYTRKHGGFYFLGRSGAVRFGSTITNSLSMSDAAKARLLSATSKAL